MYTYRAYIEFVHSSLWNLFLCMPLTLSILWESSLMLMDGLKRISYGYFSFYLRTNHHGFPWRLKARFVDYLSQVEYFDNVAFWISWIQVMIWASFERDQSIRRGGKQERWGGVYYPLEWLNWILIWMVPQSYRDDIIFFVLLRYTKKWK